MTLYLEARSFKTPIANHLFFGKQIVASVSKHSKGKWDIRLYVGALSHMVYTGTEKNAKSLALDNVTETFLSMLTVKGKKPTLSLTWIEK